jgi:hypothetical protein
MPPLTEDFSRLSLSIERLLDADLLLEEECGTLLAKIEAASRSLKEGDIEAVHGHMEQFLVTIEALVQADRIAPSTGQAVMEPAHHILSKSAD